MSATNDLSRAHFDVKKLSFLGVIVSLGIVFGDIGTSPLYVMTAIVNARRSVAELSLNEYIEGALSCIIWTLTLQTTVKYMFIALRADNKGEGGILALFSLVKNLKRRWLYLIAIIGAAALVADGVITPSLTVMASIEGLKLIPGLSEIGITGINLITALILILIFFIQQFGTAKIGRFFGPVMVLWCLTLGFFGLIHIPDNFEILRAINPYYAYKLIVTSPSALVIMGAVFLCTTGAEALYSDMGHCGAKNIRVSWIFVKSMLILNYLGQGAWILAHYELVHDKGVNPAFGVMPEWFIVPGVVIATSAAIIASQSLITGCFTIFSEAMSLNFWPNQRIDYPSGEKGQMYIQRINWGLLFFCLVVVFHFKESSKMDAAYGLSITITMLMTSVLLVFWLLKNRVNKLIVGLFVMVYFTIELGFFSANIIKFFDGGWITIALAGFIGICMYAWYNGRKIKGKFIKYVKLKEYVPIIQEMKMDTSIPQYANNLAFLSRANRDDEVEMKIIYSILRKQPKRAEHYFILNIINQESPYTFGYEVQEISPNSIYRVNFLLGYKINRRINDYFNQVLQDMMNEGVISSKSNHPSLSAHDIQPDLKFVIIDNSYINETLLSVKEKLVLNLYNFVKYIGTDDFKAWGVSAYNAVVESAPLLEYNDYANKIEPVHPMKR